MANKIKRKVAIIGGGSSAHVVIPLLSAEGFEVNLLTSRPQIWKKKIELEYQSETGKAEKVIEGSLNLISDDPKKVLADVDFVLLCMPVSQYKASLEKLAPHLDRKKKIYLGTIYGQGGFNWIADDIKKKNSLDNLVTFAFGLIPWVCRTKEYGKTGIIYGSKNKNIVAVSPLSEFEELKTTFLKCICSNDNILLSTNFLSLTLSLTNQIIHPSRMYGLYLKNKGNWKTKEEIPLFYKDFDDVSADILKKVDADYSKIRDKIKKENPNSDFEYMMDYVSLEEFYFPPKIKSIKTLFTNSKTLSLIKTPVVRTKDQKWELNRGHRFFADDIFYGLCIAKWFSEEFDIEVPMIDEILNWAQNLLKINLIVAGKLNRKCTLNNICIGTPEKYNISLNDSLL